MGSGQKGFGHVSLAAIALCALALGMGWPAFAQPAASAAAVASVPAPAPAPVKAAAPDKPATAPAADDTPRPPRIDVASVEVLDKKVRCTLDVAEQQRVPPPPHALKSPDCKWVNPQDASAKERRVMHGAGDLVVSVTGASYEKAMAYQSANAGRSLHLFLNGFDVTQDATREGVERFGDYVFLQYHLNPGKQSRAFWAALVRNATLTEPEMLTVGYGWSDAEPNSSMIPSFIGNPGVAVSTTPWLWKSIIIIIVFLAGATLYAAKTGVLRDPVAAEIASLLPAAQRLYENLQADSGKATMFKKQVWPAFGDAGADDAVCQAAALAVLDDPTKLSDTNRPAVILGLAQWRSPADSLPRAMSYSLGRLQLYAWFMFALLAGVFLWLMYSELPPLDNSILTLLGISAGTAGLSWTIDKSSTQSAGTLSRGILFDLVTGPNNDHQVHRFQSILVNVALLVVGIAHIFNGVAYPTFDQSWLIFLGISGATFAAGKQLVEQPTPPVTQR